MTYICSPVPLTYIWAIESKGSVLGSIYSSPMDCLLQVPWNILSGCGLEMEKNKWSSGPVTGQIRPGGWFSLNLSRALGSG